MLNDKIKLEKYIYTKYIMKTDTYNKNEVETQFVLNIGIKFLNLMPFCLS